MKLSVRCQFDLERFEADVPAPDGWKVRHDALDVEDGLCPTHAPAESFLADQCPGCVASWGDCGLSDAFMYSGRRTITEEMLETVTSGVCPCRVNGTLMTRNTPEGLSIKSVDLSEPSAAGSAMAAAIRGYVEMWPHR